MPVQNTLLLQLMALALEIHSSGKAQVQANLWGQMDSLSLHVYPAGATFGKDDDPEPIFAELFFLDTPMANTRLQFAIQALTDLNTQQDLAA